ncbi:hypothetical protein [Natrarchaeobaculum aegyptiacum]|uniref:hypothetical protein n=1 Tax=Natrarchaeobaculum aegyptiacum TaxID=745377 RepID=UPI00137479D5|nr:hypothetical protein [Natrarchaeobaculum aegyptiacum]
MSIDQNTLTRRKVLATSGSLSVLGVAGCLDGEDEPADDAGAAADDGDDDSADADGTETGESTVTLLVESAGGHGHDHDDHDHDDHDHDDHDHDDHDHDDHDHDDHDHDDHDHDDHGLSEHEIDHACGHMEFDEREPLSAGGDEDDAPTISDTHQPFDVALDGGEGYVIFEVDDHDHDDHDHDDHDDHDHDDHDHDDHDHDDHDHDDHDHDDHDHDHDHDNGTFAFFSDVAGAIEVVDGHVEYETDHVDECDYIEEYSVVELHDGRAVLRLSADQ